MERLRKVGNQTAAETPVQADETPYLSLRRLMWMRFKRNRLAVIGGSS